MAKQGMSRPERTHTQPHNDAPPVPELQGKAKHTKKKANPIAGRHLRPHNAGLPRASDSR